MKASNFTEDILSGKSSWYRKTIEDIREAYGFDFASIGLTAFLGAPLRWVYGAGGTSERYHRIVLTPGKGIGGIVIKSGKPMMFLDIDKQIDPREYSSYPIVFAEDLHSFCALPLQKEGRTVGSLLVAFRDVNPEYEQVYWKMINDLKESLCDLAVISDNFMNLESAFPSQSTEETEDALFSSSLSQVITAQENERKRISRELHDGISQELLSTSFLIRQIQGITQDERTRPLFSEINGKIDTIMDELHNLSVELRPSTLDHLGLLPALRSRALVFEKTYGSGIVFEGNFRQKRFDQALEIQVYRICQEVILNACKYSGSDTIVVDLEEADGWLQATISDTGCGFNTKEALAKGRGCGLSGIQERAHLIGATVKVVSNDSGTVVTLLAPMSLTKKESRND